MPWWSQRRGAPTGCGSALAHCYAAVDCYTPILSPAFDSYSYAGFSETVVSAPHFFCVLWGSPSVWRLDSPP